MFKFSRQYGYSITISEPDSEATGVQALNEDPLIFAIQS